MYAIIMEMVGLLKAYESTGYMEYGPANNRVKVPIDWSRPQDELTALTDKVNSVRAHATANEPEPIPRGGRAGKGEGNPL